MIQIKEVSEGKKLKHFDAYASSVMSTCTVIIFTGTCIIEWFRPPITSLQCFLM